MTAPRPRVSPLRRRMIEDMTARNLSPATQRSYLHAVAKFSRYFSRSPDRLDIEDVRAFQVFLVSQKISWPALNQTVCALRFFYGVTLNRPEIPERIAYAREPRKLPVILSADEVVRFLEAVPSLKTRTALTTAYAAGLRASEAVSLKVADIDSSRMLIQVRHGKGAKDRTVMLSPQLLATRVRFRWRDYRQANQSKLMTLDAPEFIRRFLLHGLPDGFHRIRHYGFLANGHRQSKLALIRRLLDQPAPLPTRRSEDYRERVRELTGVDLSRCPCCGGAMRVIDILPCTRAPPIRPASSHAP